MPEVVEALLGDTREAADLGRPHSGGYRERDQLGELVGGSLLCGERRPASGAHVGQLCSQLVSGHRRGRYLTSARRSSSVPLASNQWGPRRV